MSESCADLPLGWAFRTLEQIAAKVTSGATPTSGSSRFYVENGGLPFAKTEDLTRARSKFIDNCELAVSDAALRETAVKRYPAGTILVSMYGTIGLTKIAAVPMAANQALCALIPPFACHPGYLFHHLDYVREGWTRYSGQTTQANINGATVKTHAVPLPPLEQQVKIAEILDTCDAVIQKTEALIDNLKAIKQGLLHDLLTRGIDANGRLRPPRAEAPHLYKESSLGWIPKDWEASYVAEEFDIDAGIALGAHRAPKHRPRQYLRVANVQRGRLALENVAELEATDAEVSARELQVFDLLVVEGHASSSEIGRCAMADESVRGMLFQNHLFRLRAMRLLPRFALLWLNSAFAQSYWHREAATSSGLHTINRSKLGRLPIAVPRHEEQSMIVEREMAFADCIEGETRYLAKLRTEKSALMDDLLTGRVRVTPLLAKQPTERSA